MKTMTPASPLNRAIDADHMQLVLDEFIATYWPDAELQSVQVPRVIPKKSGEVVIQYELTYYPQDESRFLPHTLFAQFLPNGLNRKCDAAKKPVWYEELKLLIWPFPSDPELDHLSLLCDAERFHDTYDADLENVGYSSVSMGTPAVVLGYRLGRRCVARVRWQDRVSGHPASFPKNDIVVKMARRRQTLALWTRWRQLEHEGLSHNSTDGIGMPKSLFLHSDTGALFQDYAHEPSVHDLIGCEDLPFHCGKAALTLAKLHASHIPGLAPYTTAEEMDHLHWLTAITGQSFPIVALDLAGKLNELIKSAPADNPGVYVTAHRDFYDKQVLSGELKTVLLDCDTLTLADPALDYGNFVAHLCWRAQQHPEHAASITEAVAQFKEIYTVHSRDFCGRALWWTKAALLRLACIYTWRPRWHHHGVTLAEIDHGSLCEV